MPPPALPPPLRGMTICTSDGASNVIQNGKSVVNGPSTVPDATGRAYQQLAPDHPKVAGWRKKLADYMVKDLNCSHLDKKCTLTELPRGFSIWVHLAATDGASKSKRTDAYLYGHPFGPTKRYRSAEEFRAHLYWLASNQEVCLCKVCQSSGTSMAPLEEAEGTNMVNSEEAEGSNMPEVGKAEEATQSYDVSKTAGQLLDLDPYVNFIFRTGELVWFSKGTAWGLAVICTRRMLGEEGYPGYFIAPLSHPLRTLQPIVRSQEDLRPWLAWTLPHTTHPQIADMKYDEVPWERVLAGEFGPGDAEVDGSILIGKEVNNSYTPIHVLPLDEYPGLVFYDGIFLGAEKIWVGEAVRLHVPVYERNVMVMVIKAIFEPVTGPNEPKLPLRVLGDTYVFVPNAPKPPNYHDQSKWPTQDLPERMICDLQWRNENAFEKELYQWCEWHLQKENHRIPLSEIKGRWYDSIRLQPIMRPEEFRKEAATGETSDCGLWMNPRGEVSDNSLVRKSRVKAFGKAVPKDLKAMMELEGPPLDSKLPKNIFNIVFDDDSTLYGPLEGESEEA